MKKLLILLCFPVALAAQEPSRWVLLTPGFPPNVELDTASIRKVSQVAEGVSAWLRTQASPDQKTEERKAFAYTLSRPIYNCATSETAIAAVIAYDSAGKSVSRIEHAPREWKFRGIVPDSRGEAQLQLICRVARYRKIIK